MLEALSRGSSTPRMTTHIPTETRLLAASGNFAATEAGGAPAEQRVAGWWR